MTKVPCPSLIGAVIVFGSVTSRAFVCRAYLNNCNQVIQLRTSRKRTLPSKEHTESSLFLPSKPIDETFCAGILQSKYQNIDPTFEDLLQFELLSSISAVPEEDWDRCLCPEASPFMEHSWLRCLEEAGCATVDTGWMPSHVLIRMGDRVCGFVPVRFVLGVG
jgi:Peptidogalycan biosysnthesis/recognition